ncbi:Sm-like ribonucleo protein [Aspergillus uvarum CBS 121591]|uniref:U6 snRNA-associated Sm-like protein LSm1 n=2 Tax=Aspergillus TaxID=5052 RepID=A0A319CBS3_9EURO|nr:Sm-like ribonucleo protein [Aspergillus uvarum CBS 121591]PYH83025.1 Sm-like ribonucleo protein [Aspergillus uvarum CBS 121591]PYI16492.1 Sm-like ribonucleo protein [Aspergillus violaceofuscus CBS 115571]
MERLSINETPGGGPQGNAPQGFPPQNNNTLGPMTHGPPQLPPQMFTTAAQLLDLTDKKLVLVLRDGRKLIGVLRSWDQFANLVLQDTIERLYSGNLYADIPRGIFLVRGENVLLLGEIDLDKEDDVPPHLQRASFQEVFELKKQEETKRKSNDKKRHGKLQTLGFEPEHSGEILF